MCFIVFIIFGYSNWRSYFKGTRIRRLQNIFLNNRGGPRRHPRGDLEDHVPRGLHDGGRQPVEPEAHPSHTI